MSASVPSADARYLAFSDAHLHLMVGEAEEVAEGKQEYQQRVYFNDKNTLRPYMPRPVQYSGSDKTESRHWNHKVYKGRECGACQKRSLCTKAKARELLIDIREPLLQKMREKLISEEGRRKYFMRQYISDYPFSEMEGLVYTTPEGKTIKGFDIPSKGLIEIFYKSKDIKEKNKCTSDVRFSQGGRRS